MFAGDDRGSDDGDEAICLGPKCLIVYVNTLIMYGGIPEMYGGNKD